MALVEPYTVDFVYTWIDGSDSLHGLLRNHFLRKAGLVHESAVGNNRWRDNGELQASIRSVLRFASWVHRIYVVCSLEQEPMDLPCDPRIHIVQDTTIFADHRCLPVFNSHAVEANIHRIPGLSERFVYMCDDMFLGRYIEVADLFPEGMPAVHFGNLLTTLTHTPRTAPCMAARMNNITLLSRAGLTVKMRDVSHQGRPLLRSGFERLQEMDEIRQMFGVTSRSRFRCRTDLEPTGLVSQWLFYSGLARRGRCSRWYCSVDNKKDVEGIRAYLHQERPALFCLNDCMCSPDPARLKEYRKLLRTGLPHCVDRDREDPGTNRANKG